MKLAPLTMVLFAGSVVTAAGQSNHKINVAKMRPKGLLVDRYSYMAQPYSFHYFHHIDQLGFRLDTVARSGTPFPLAGPTGPFSVTYEVGGVTRSLEEYFERNFVTGFLVLRDSQIVVERYFHGATAETPFVSQSIGKSILSILVGIAVDQGKIASVDDPVVKYLPYLASSGYERATIKNVLQMATGVAYSENYRDSTSGAAAIGAALVSGEPSFKDYVSSMRPTSTPPGTKFEYQSVNTQVLGFLVEQVTGKRLNDFATEALWSKLGVERDAFFYQSRSQPDICAFACFNATLRDYARVGLLMLRGGTLGGRRIVSEDWVARSTRADAPYLEPAADSTGRPGYGYQWWLPPGRPGAFEAIGIYGQSIYVDPSKRLVIVRTSAWPTPIGSPELYAEARAVREAIGSKL